ncbi:MAG: glycosyltransferase family 2 protein [Gammaproteobacteria bacterium]
MKRVSAIVLTFNSEQTIQRTLECARKIADTIYVVDSFSTDKTLDFARECGSQVVQHEFESYGIQRNWAIDNLKDSNEWQLHLDADEYITDALVNEILSLTDEIWNNVDGFLIPRKIRFLDRELNHGGLYPIWHLRLFRSSKGRCELRKYDQHFYVQGRTAKLRNPMIDDHKMSLGEWTARHNRWADAEAAELVNPQIQDVIVGNINGNAIQKKRSFRAAYNRLPLFIRPFLFFIYRYLFRAGFLDGKEGLIYLVLQTFWFRFLVDAKYYELTRKRLNKPSSSSLRMR